MPEASLIVIAGAFVGGFVSGLTGFGTGISAMPIWLHGLTPALASPLVVVCSLIGQFQTLPAIWHAIDFRRCVPFIVGGLIGVPFGAWLLPFISVPVFKLAVGTLLVVYCSFTLAGRIRMRVHGGGKIADAMIGLGGGVMGGRAVLQAFNTSILSFALVAQAFTGLLTAELWQLVLIALPGTILGSWIGRRLYTKLDSAKFEKVVLVLLLMSGGALLIGGFGRA